MTSLYDQKLPWHWPLSYDEPNTLNIFLDEFIGVNPLIPSEQRLELVENLYQSLSLDFIEKKNVIKSYSTLSVFQVTELIKVFQEEEEKFRELEKDHLSDVEKLVLRNACLWAMLLAKKHGARSFLSKWIFSNNDAISLDSKISIAGLVNHQFNIQEYYTETLAHAQFLLEQDYLFTDEQHPSVAIQLVNEGLFCLVETNECKTPKELGDHNIAQYVTKIRNSEFSDSTLKYQKLALAFLEQCIFVYPISRNGIKKSSEKERKELIRLQKHARAPLDISSWFSFYYMCLGEKSDYVINAAWLSVFRNFKGRKFKKKRMREITRNAITATEVENSIRNLFRYYIITKTFKPSRLRGRNRFFSTSEIEKKMLSVFLDELHKIPRYGASYLDRNLEEIIIISFMMNDKRILDHKFLIRHIEDSENTILKYIFQLCFARNTYGNDLDDLQIVFPEFSSKESLLFYSFAIKDILLQRSFSDDEKKRIVDVLCFEYTNTCKKKGWFLNKEINILKKTAF